MKYNVDRAPPRGREFGVHSKAIDIQPLSGKIGARATGVDLSRPLDDATFERLHAAWLDAAVLAIPAQDAMTIEDLVAFSRRFGELDTNSLARNSLAGHPEIFVVSNVTEDGKFVGARVSRSWHSDGQYLAAPTKASILHAREVPPDGGDTLFVEMAAVLDALPAATRRRIAGLKVVHSRVKTHAILFPSWAPLTEEEKARMPDAVHPLVRTHPETGRQALYVGGNSAWEIEGMAHDEGRALIGELRDFATGPRFVHVYRWRVGDVVIWDNRSAMHCPTDFDETAHRRVMYRTTVKGDAPV